MPEAVNPYAPPKARVDDVVQAGPEAEVLRRKYIKHEAAIRSCGILDYIGGVAFCFLGGGMLLSNTLYRSALGAGALAAVAAVYLVIGILSIIVGFGIRRLRPWARIASVVLSAIGLLEIPIGTVINGYILYLLASRKGQLIFTPQYAEIIAATPHVKYRSFLVLWVILGVLAALILFGVAVALFSRGLRA